MEIIYISLVLGRGNEKQKSTTNVAITTTLAEDGLYLGYGVNIVSNKWLKYFCFS